MFPQMPPVLNVHVENLALPVVRFKDDEQNSENNYDADNNDCNHGSRT